MPIRWGIVTSGKIANDFVNALNSYSKKGDNAIVGIAARDKKKAEEFAKKYNIPKVFDSYQDLATSKDIDVVYIGALNPDHHALTTMFLNNGKHVLCEKPLCMNFKQAQSLVKLAQQKKLFLMEAVWSRFSPAYVELEKQINDGQLGDIEFVEVNFGKSIEDVDRLSTKKLGGSAVMDLGIYALQFAQYIFKEEPIKVTAVGKLNEDGVDKGSTIILEYSGDRRAVLNVYATVTLWNKATVYGSKGRATLEDPFNFPTKLTRVDGNTEEFPLHISPLPYNFENSAGLVYEALEVNKCIKQGLLESPRMSHQESLTIAKLEDEVRKQLGVHYDVDDKEYN